MLHLGFVIQCWNQDGFQEINIIIVISTFYINPCQA